MIYKSILWIKHNKLKIKEFSAPIIIIIISTVIIISGLYFYMDSSVDSASNPKSFEYRALIISKLKNKSNRHGIKKSTKCYYICLSNQLKRNSIKREECQRLIKKYLNVSNIMRKTLSSGYIGITFLYFIFYVPLILFVMIIEFNMRINLLKIFDLLLKQSISSLAIYSITINLSSIMTKSLTFGRYLSIFIPTIGYTIFMLQLIIKEIILDKHSFTYQWIPPILHK